MKRLSCCSDLVRREGVPLPVCDRKGDFLIDSGIWEECKQEMASRIVRTVSGYLVQDPTCAQKAVGFELMDWFTK